MHHLRTAGRSPAEASAAAVANGARPLKLCGTTVPAHAPAPFPPACSMAGHGATCCYSAAPGAPRTSTPSSVRVRAGASSNDTCHPTGAGVGPGDLLAAKGAWRLRRRGRAPVVAAAAAVTAGNAGHDDDHAAGAAIAPRAPEVRRYQKDMLDGMMNFLGPAAVVPMGDALMSLVDTITIGQVRVRVWACVCEGGGQRGPQARVWTG